MKHKYYLKPENRMDDILLLKLQPILKFLISYRWNHSIYIRYCNEYNFHLCQFHHNTVAGLQFNQIIHINQVKQCNLIHIKDNTFNLAILLNSVYCLDCFLNKLSNLGIMLSYYHRSSSVYHPNILHNSQFLFYYC